MKILITTFGICDLGGIINHTEHLIHGLKELGHHVKLVRLENKSKLVKSTTKRNMVEDTFSGLPLDQRAGWFFPLENRVPFKSVDWKKYTSNYDLIIWEVPFPPKDWNDVPKSELYDVGSTPQIAIIHDGNMEKLYPKLASYEELFEFFACVHDCALGNARSLGVENAKLIVNPQANVKYRMERCAYDRGVRKNIFSMQTFKAWKRVDEFVRAVPHMENVNSKILCGGGIEYYYMTSKDKRKPAYGKIWERALKAGMEYLGYISEDERDDFLRNSRLMIDASWSKRYAWYGSHFNRMMVDALICGCVPVLRDLAMENQSAFADRVWFEIPWDAGPGEFAEVVDEVIGPSYKNKARIMVKIAQKEIKKKFDSVAVAKEFV